jgi:hypothetical protein
LVIAVRAALVPALVAITEAPAIAAPLLSRTSPLMEASV